MWCLCFLMCGLLAVTCSAKEGGAAPPEGNDYFNWWEFFKGDGGKAPSTPVAPVKGLPPVKNEAQEDLFDNIEYSLDVGYDDEDGEYDDEDEFGRRGHAVRTRKLPPDMFCKKEQKEALNTFCKGLPEGEYYDPWNPYCGFIRCKLVDPVKSKRRMSAFRGLCRSGTWVSDQDKKMRSGRDSICRVRLAVSVDDKDRCLGGSLNMDNPMCEPAKRVLQMNDKTEIY